MSILASEKGLFYYGKMKDFAGWAIPGPGGSPTASRGGFRGASRTFGVIEKSLKLANSVFSRGETRIRLTLNLSGSRTFRETTREGAAILEGTVQDWVFPQENMKRSYRFMVNSGIIKGVLFDHR